MSRELLHPYYCNGGQKYIYTEERLWIQWWEGWKSLWLPLSLKEVCDKTAEGWGRRLPYPPADPQLPVVLWVEGVPPASGLGDPGLGVSQAVSSLFSLQRPHNLPGSYNGRVAGRTQHGAPSESGDIFRLVEPVSGGLEGWQVHCSASNNLASPRSPAP